MIKTEEDYCGPNPYQFMSYLQFTLRITARSELYVPHQ